MLEILGWMVVVFVALCAVNWTLIGIGAAIGGLVMALEKLGDSMKPGDGD